MKEKTSSLAAVLTALPWCCIVPAMLALLGLAGLASVRIVAINLMPFLLALSLLLLGRAHYLIHVRRHGHRVSRGIVWVSTALAVGMWLLRLL